MIKYYVGIDVGGTKIAYGVFNEKNDLVDKLIEKTQSNLEPDIMIDNMCSNIKKLFDKNSISINRLDGVGAAFPSHIDFTNGLVITTSNLPKWNYVPIRDIISDKLGVRVSIDNDANAAAIAEHMFGAGKEQKNMLYITISTGIGGGIIINNKIFRGTYGSAGEFGHMIIREDGYLCGCGNKGCVQSVASGPKIEKYTIDMIKGGTKTILTDMLKNVDDITCSDINKAAQAGDKFANDVIVRTGKLIGIMFANLYQIFNIDHYVVGGGVSKFGKLLFDTIEKKVSQLSIMSHDYPVTIVPASLGDDVGIIGAYALLLLD